MQQFTTTTNVEPIYSWRQAQPLFCCSRTTAWRLVRAGELPKPIRISRGRIGWRHSDIAAWQAQRTAAAGLQTGAGGLSHGRPSPEFQHSQREASRQIGRPGRTSDQVQFNDAVDGGGRVTAANGSAGTTPAYGPLMNDDTAPPLTIVDDNGKPVGVAVLASL